MEPEEYGQIIEQTPCTVIESETYVLGALLVRQGETKLIECGDLSPSDFYRGPHKIIFEAMLQLAAEKNPIDTSTVHDVLKANGKLHHAGGRQYLVDLMLANTTTALIPYHSQRIREMSIHRQAVLNARSMAQKILEGGDAQEQITVVSEQMKKLGIRLAPVTEENVQDVLDGLYQEFNSRMENPGQLPGLSTGFDAIDDAINGIAPTDLIVIGARPNMGKSILVDNIAQNLAIANFPVALFSVESPKKDVLERMVVRQSGLFATPLKRGQIYHENDQKALEQARKDLKAMNLRVYDTKSKIRTHLQMIQELRRLCSIGKKPALAIVDYLQRLPSIGEETRNRELEKICHDFQDAARELEIPIILVCQIDRESTKGANKRPTIAHLKDSGAIEQDADTILLIHREEYFNPETDKKHIAEIIVGKARNAEAGKTIELAFHGGQVSFFNLDQYGRADRIVRRPATTVEEAPPPLKVEAPWSSEIVNGEQWFTQGSITRKVWGDEITTKEAQRIRSMSGELQITAWKRWYRFIEEQETPMFRAWAEACTKKIEEKFEELEKETPTVDLLGALPQISDVVNLLAGI